MAKYFYKYIKPKLLQNTVNRELFKSKVTSNVNLIYLYAPGGYGKTTAVLSWIEQMKYTVSWFTLDEYDNNDFNFCFGLLSAFDIDFNSEELFNTPLSYTLEKFHPKNQIKFPDVIVLDNLHLCKSTKYVKILLQLYQWRSRGTKLLLLSRTQPPDEFAEIIIKGEMKIFTIEDLRLDKKEMSCLAKKYDISFSAEVLNTILMNTNGWIILIISILRAYRNGDIDTFGEDNLVCMDALYKYIKMEVSQWEEDIQLLLIKASIHKLIDVNYCINVLNERNSKQILLQIAGLTGFIVQVTPTVFKFHDLVANYFEQEFSRCEILDKQKLYDDTVDWYLNEKNLIAALQLAFQSKNPERMNRVIQNISEQNEIDIARYVAVFIDTLAEAELENLHQYPNLCMRLAWVNFLRGNFIKMKRYLNILETLFIENEFKSADEAVASFFIRAVDPSVSSTDFLTLATQFSNYQPTKKILNTFTHSLPFFHKAQRDYADITPCMEEYLFDLKTVLAPLFGENYEPLHQLLKAGLYYEKGELEEAHAIVSQVQVLNESIEIFFAREMLLVEILFAKEENEKAFQILKKTKLKLEKCSLQNIKKNFCAYEIRQKLYDGDKQAAAEWLSMAYIQIEESFNFCNCYQYLTTARALIVRNKIEEAIAFLEKLLQFNKSYHREIDLMECFGLLSICYKIKGNMKKALQNIMDAILLAHQRAIIMPIVLLGNDIIYSLKCFNNKQHNIDKAFISKILYLTAERGKVYQGLHTDNENRLEIKLSNRQEMILHLLAQNLTYFEIGEKAGVKITTVREHISRIYQKLEVNNSYDAVLKARKLGLIKD